MPLTAAGTEQHASAVGTREHHLAGVIIQRGPFTHEVMRVREKNVLSETLPAVSRPEQDI